MRERIRCYSISNRRSIGEDLRTRLELAGSKGNLGSSYRNRKRPFSKNLDLTSFITDTAEANTSLIPNGHKKTVTSISTIGEVFRGKDLVDVETSEAVINEASKEDIKKRSEYELLRARRYINNGSKKMTVAMRIFALRKGLRVQKPIMHHTR